MSGIPTGQLQHDQVLLTGDEAISVYNRGYYGMPSSDGVTLTGFEALHLFELSRIQILTDQQLISEEQLMAHFSSVLEDFMSRYLVYKDLRNRGYVVNQGGGSSFFFRLYERGDVPKQDSATYYITPLREGTSIKLTELDDLVKLSKRSRKTLVFGLVDASGDVSYLSVNQLYPDQIGNSHVEGWNWTTKWEDYLTWDD